MRSPTLAIPLACACALLWALPLGAQSPQVLVLGTYHFGNPGLDVVKTEVADVLSPEKQAEIAAVAETLARFRPTRIAVEWEPSRRERLDSLYGAYRAGRHVLSRSETEQLGFRLASGGGHDRVYPIDQRGDFPFQEVMDYAQLHDPAFVAFVGEELARVAEEANRLQACNTVGEILRVMNDPRRLADDHGIYMRFASVGAGDTFVGAGLVAKWYERNIKIFANLQRLAEPGSRVLVIIGAGHAPILREFVDSDRGMVLVDPADYLPSGEPAGAERCGEGGR